MLTGFSFKEDRLKAITILSDYWHNRRKKHTDNLAKEQDALALADLGGEQFQVSKIIQCYVVYTATPKEFCLQLPSTQLTMSNVTTLMWCVMLQSLMPRVVVRVVRPSMRMVRTMPDLYRMCDWIHI